MKNIYEIMKQFGVEIPEDKKADFDKMVIDNYKTVAEVEKISTKLKTAETDLATAKSQADTLATEMETLKTNGATAAEIQAKFDEYKSTVEQAEQTRQQAEQQAQAENEFQSRWKAAAVDKDGKPFEFVSPLVDKALFAEFKAALADESNKGKGDRDIITSLVTDQQGIFKTNVEVNLPSGANVPANGGNPFAKGNENITEQMKLFKQNPDVARSMAAEAGVTIN